MNDYEKLLYKSNKQKRQLGILIKKITYYKQELKERDKRIKKAMLLLGASIDTQLAVLKAMEILKKR